MGAHGECAIPDRLLGARDVIERLTELPGFDEAGYSAALRSTDNARFSMWRREEG